MTTHHADEPLSRRAAVAGLGAAGIGMALAAVSGSAAAQEASPVPLADHPIIGTWVFDFDPANPGTLVAFASFHADGTRTDLHPFAGPGVGVWSATSARTGRTVSKFQNIAAEPGAFTPGIVTRWESFTVDESGDRFTFVMITELRASDGTVVGRFPFAGEPAQRLIVEPAPALEAPEATPAT
jgi:hypothetical protein